MFFVDEERTRKVLAFRDLIAALEKAFLSECKVPARMVEAITANEQPLGTLLLMPAWMPGRYLGVKTVCVFPGNAALGLSSLHSTYLLYDACTGVPLAQMDGNEITSRRTAAASALAARFLSRRDAATLLVVGAGRMASVLPHAYSVIRPIRRVLIWSLHEHNAHKLAERLTHEGLTADVAVHLKPAVDVADIISCATLSREPLIRGAWLRLGVHLDLIGGFAPDMRESDDECYRNANVFIDTDEALIKAGDLLSPIANGILAISDVRATLAQLCQGVHPGRTDDRQITIFKSVGTALEDLAAAALVYERSLGDQGAAPTS